MINSAGDLSFRETRFHHDTEKHFLKHRFILEMACWQKV